MGRLYDLAPHSCSHSASLSTGRGRVLTGLCGIGGDWGTFHQSLWFQTCFTPQPQRCLQLLSFRISLTLVEFSVCRLCFSFLCFCKLVSTTCLSPFHSYAPVSPPSLYVLENSCIFFLSCHFRGDSRRGEGKHVFNLPLLIKSFSISLCLFLNIYLAVLGLSCGRWDRGAQLPQGMWDLSSLARDGTHIPCIER